MLGFKLVCEGEPCWVLWNRLGRGKKCLVGDGCEPIGFGWIGLGWVLEKRDDSCCRKVIKIYCVVVGDDGIVGYGMAIAVEVDQIDFDNLSNVVDDYNLAAAPTNKIVDIDQS